MRLIDFCKLSDEDKEKYQQWIYSQFNKCTVEQHILIIKGYMKTLSVPSWLDKRIISDKKFGYTLTMLDNDVFSSLDMHPVFVCEDDKCEHFHIDVKLNITGLYIGTGEHRRTVQRVLEVDIDDFFERMRNTFNVQ